MENQGADCRGLFIACSVGGGWSAKDLPGKWQFQEDSAGLAGVAGRQMKKKIARFHH